MARMPAAITAALIAAVLGAVPASAQLPSTIPSGWGGSGSDSDQRNDGRGHWGGPAAGTDDGADDAADDDGGGGAGDGADDGADPAPPDGWIDGGDLLPPSGAEDPGSGPLPPAGARPVVKGRMAALGANGVAHAPSKAPRQVKLAIWAANELRKKPYKWGGGHRGWRDSGYDCSGAVSFALHAAGLLNTPLDSTGFTRYGARGAGRWITIYANKGHIFMVVAGLRFDTSPYGSGDKGPRWRATGRPAGGFKVRHPAGL